MTNKCKVLLVSLWFMTLFYQSNVAIAYNISIIKEVIWIWSELETIRYANQDNDAKAVAVVVPDNEVHKPDYDNEYNKLKAAMIDIPIAHADEVLRILGHIRTNEDITREQLERKRQDEEAEKERHSFGHQLAAFWMDVFQIAH